MFAGIGLVVVVIIVAWLLAGCTRAALSEPSTDIGVTVDAAYGRIAFDSNRDGDHEIYVMNDDGSGLVQLTNNEFGDHSPAWSPDGGRIAFASDRDNDVDIYDIYVMNADGSDVERLTDGVSPAWSPLWDLGCD